MVTVFDIAAHIRGRIGDPGRMKLLKLAYYVQAWSLVWREQPAFDDRIEAWKDGPVVATLWTDLHHHEGHRVKSGRPLAADMAALVDRVLVSYGHLSADALSALTHDEEPWNHARGNTPKGVASSAEITHDSMRRFYGHRWIEAERDNAAAAGEPAFRGSIDELEALLDS